MNPIKKFIMPLLIACAVVSGSLHAQQINWGSAVFSDLVDSNGNTIGDTYVFELGTFVNNFTPTESNTDLWYANWQAYDAAAYNGIEAVDDDGIYGYFTSSVQMEADGTSGSTAMSPGAISFEGLDAYLWVRNSDVAEIGSEWLLARADDWVFPDANPDCCGNDLPIEWSTSDLTADYTPVWGSQAGNEGGGVIDVSGYFTLQTATFVPEPSTLLLSMIAGFLLILRRRR